MSKYFTAWDNFAVDTIGSSIVGWTARGSATPTRLPTYGAVASVPFKRRYLAFTPTSSADHACVTWDALDADADRDDFDILTLVVLPLATSTVHNIFARGAGSAPATDYYRAKALYSGGNLTVSIEERVASASVSSLASTALGAWSASTSFWFRFRGNGTSLSATAWAVGTTEPTTPTVSVTDGSLTAAGWCGLGGAGSGLVCAFNCFAVGTNGDVAVRPRTNAEYTAWLANQEALRVITARLAFTGYDSAGSPYTATRYAYISNHGYTSQEQDTPARQHFDNFITAVPTFSREMPAALSGQAVVNFGEMRMKNPARPVAGAAYLLMDGGTGYASTPDSAAASITGDIDIRVDLEATDWTPGTAMSLVSKRGGAGLESYRLRITTTGTLYLEHSTDGTTVLFSVSTAAVGFTDGSRRWVRAARVSATGVVTFYTSTDGVTWTTLGTTVAGTAGAIFNSTAALQIGAAFSGTTEPSTGKIYRVQIYTGSTLAVDFNLTNVLKGATSFSAPTGEVWTINGTARIRQADDTAPGALDDWLRVHWIRDGFEMQLGAPDWPLHDFRHVVRGRLGLPTAPRPDEMVFRIADMSDALNVPLTDQTFTTGDRTNRPKPVFIGHNVTGHIEPPQSDFAALEWTLHDATINLADAVAYDNHLALVTLLQTVSAVDAGTDTITSSGLHGMVDGYRVRFTSGTPPAPLALSTDYYAVSVTVGGSNFKLSATVGGAAINLTTTSTGAAMVFYGYRADNATAKVTLAATPAGRVTFTNVKSNSGLYDVANIYSDIVFSRAGLSLNHKDSGSFTALTAALGFTARLFFDDSKHACNEAVEKLSVGSMSWYGFTNDGLMQVGLIDLPAATAVQSFDGGNVKAGSLRLVDRIRPIDFSVAQITCEPYFLSGGPLPPVGSTGQVIQERTTVTPYSYGATSTPLDNYPSVSDANVNASFDWVMDNGNAEDRRDAIAALFLQSLGIYEFDTTLPAAELNIGDTISLDFPRLGWKAWSSADPASPDNTATIDSRLAVVIGLNVNLSAAGPFKVRVKCFRRQPGYYPTANLN